MKKYNMKQTIATCESNLAVAVCRNLKLILLLDKNTNFLQKLTSQKALEKLLLWSFSWGIGSCLYSQYLSFFEKAL